MKRVRRGRPDGPKTPVNKEVLLTEARLRGFFAQSTEIRIIRSGYVPDPFPDFVEALRDACRPTGGRRKRIRIILPRDDSLDLEQRASCLNARKYTPAALRNGLREWYRRISELQAELQDRHSVELLQTGLPHRYVAFGGDHELFFTPAWHFYGAEKLLIHVTVKSPLRKHLLVRFQDDFDAHWVDLSRASETADAESVSTGARLGPLPVLGLNQTMARVILALSDLGGGKRRVALKAIAKAAGLTDGTVLGALRDLREIGHVGFLREKVDALGDCVKADGSFKSGNRITKLGELLVKDLQKAGYQSNPNARKRGA